MHNCTCHHTTTFLHISECFCVASSFNKNSFFTKLTTLYTSKAKQNYTNIKVKVIVMSDILLCFAYVSSYL